MDAYPFDLVLAVVVASVTIFLGFLPAKAVRSRFFAREAFKATAAWIVVTAIAPLSVMHYPFILAVFCFIAWWNFQRDDTFAGKIWLSLAAGLGISLGVMVILAVTPDSWPMTSPAALTARGPLQAQAWDWGQAWGLASLYLGGAIMGLAYVGYTLCREAATRAGLGGFIQNCLGLLFNLTLVRGAVLLVEAITVPGAPARDTSDFRKIFFMFPQGIPAEDLRHVAMLLIGVCVFLILPVLAYFARRGAGFSSRLQPTRLLAAIILVGFITEILARIVLL